MIPDVMPEYHNLTDSQKINILGMAVTDVRNKTDEHHKILVLGDPPTLPLPERVRNLEDFKKNIDYWGRFLGGALLLNFLGFTAGIVVALVKFLPVLERLANQP